MFLTVAIAAASAVAEESDFQKQVAGLPENRRAEAIQTRMDWKHEVQRQRVRVEMIEAIKPHNLWSFLGLGSK